MLTVLTNCSVRHVSCRFRLHEHVQVIDVDLVISKIPVEMNDWDRYLNFFFKRRHRFFLVGFLMHLFDWMIAVSFNSPVMVGTRIRSISSL